MIKCGSQHLRSGAFELNVLEFYMVDIFVFVAAIVLVLLISVVTMLYITCKCCIYCLCPKRTRKVKTN